MKIKPYFEIRNSHVPPSFAALIQLKAPFYRVQTENLLIISTESARITVCGKHRNLVRLNRKVQKIHNYWEEHNIRLM